MNEDKPSIKSIQQRLTSTRAKAIYVAIAVAVFAIAVLTASVIYRGIVATIVFTVLFLVMLTVIPTLIGLMGDSVPGNKLLAKLQMTLAAVAANHHYLVQTDDGYEWCVGDEQTYYLNGEVYEIDDGFENRSVLGWRPFGVLRHKNEQTLRSVRADIAAKKDRAAADGGANTIERGGYQETQDPNVSGIDGNWVVDLKRVFSSGIRKIGDIELIETAEEMIERGQVDDSRLSGLGPIIGSLVGMLMGAILAYIMVVA